MPRWLSLTQAAALVLVGGSMQLPYRLAHDNDVFPVVHWGEERCYLLGERAEDVLLFCPTMAPRNRRIEVPNLHLDRADAGESLFASFAPPVPSAPR